MNAIQQHLEQITVQALQEWSMNAFISFASCSGRNGYVQIGVCSDGFYMVKINYQNYGFLTADEAIELYTSFIS